MADNLNQHDLDAIINIIREHQPAPFGTDLIKKLQALRDTYWLYPDVWVSTVMFIGNEVVERRADVWHVSQEVYDEIIGLDKDE